MPVLRTSLTFERIQCAYFDATGEWPDPEGVAAILHLISEDAYYQIARNLDRYDNRSLHEFAVSLAQAAPAHPR